MSMFSEMAEVENASEAAQQDAFPFTSSRYVLQLCVLTFFFLDFTQYLKKRLVCARSQVMNVIERIGLSRDSTERFQIFDSDLGK